MIPNNFLDAMGFMEFLRMFLAFLWILYDFLGLFRIRGRGLGRGLCCPPPSTPNSVVPLLLVVVIVGFRPDGSETD